MTKSRRRVVISLVVLAVVVGIASEAYRFFDKRAVEREAAQATSVATASASVATDPDEACRWLEANGYGVVMWNPNDPRGFIGRGESPDGTYRIVQGRRLVRDGNWLIKPTWLELTFRFNRDGTYHDVQASQSDLKFPGEPRKPS